MIDVGAVAKSCGARAFGARMGALALAWLAPGCALPVPCGRGAAADGTCCPPWTRAVDGTCAPRSWSELPAAQAGLGPAASYPAVAVDAALRLDAGGGRWLAPPGGERFSFPPFGDQHELLVSRDGEIVVTWVQGVQGRQPITLRGACLAERPPGAAAFRRPANQQDVL